MLEERLPGHGQPVAELQTRGILLDGTHRGRQAAPAAADLLADAARPGVLRVHPAQGRRRLRRRQLQGAVRVDRARPGRAAACCDDAHERDRAEPATSPASATSSPPRRCRARCRSAATRRSAAPTASMPSSCPAPPSPRRAPTTGAPGSTASARRRCTRRSSASTPAASSATSTTCRRRRTSCAGTRCRCRTAPTDFVDGLVTMAGNGDPHAQTGAAVAPLRRQPLDERRVFYNADGELLIVPQQGRQRFVTELGVIDAEPQEIVVIPRGVRFRVELPDGSGARLRLRELRRALPPARPRADRLERPGQPARLPDAGRRLRGRRRAARAGRQVHGPPVVGADGPLAARRRRLARQLRAVQVRPAPLQRDRLDQLRPSRPVDLPGAAQRVRHARRRATSTS